MYIIDEAARALDSTPVGTRKQPDAAARSLRINFRQVAILSLPLHYLATINARAPCFMFHRILCMHVYPTRDPIQAH